MEGKKKGEKFRRSTVYILKIRYVFHVREVKSRIQFYIFKTQGNIYYLLLRSLAGGVFCIIVTLGIIYIYE